MFSFAGCTDIELADNGDGTWSVTGTGPDRRVHLPRVKFAVDATGNLIATAEAVPFDNTPLPWGEPL